MVYSLGFGFPFCMLLANILQSNTHLSRVNVMYDKQRMNNFSKIRVCRWTYSHSLSFSVYFAVSLYQRSPHYGP